MSKNKKPVAKPSTVPPEMSQLYQTEITELKDAVRYLELQLVEKRKEQEGLFRDLEKANSNAALNEGMYNRETGVTKAQNYKINSLEDQIRAQKDGQKDFIEKTRTKIND